MTGLTGPTRRTPDDIASLLEDELVSGRLSAGSKLPSERQLAQRMGVGRPLVREALRTLVERGLLEVSPGRGAFVRNLQPADIARPMAAGYRRSNATTRDLVEARMMLECEAAALAAQRATDDETARLASALAGIEAASSVIDRSRADVAFHRQISEAAHNPVIGTMFASISGLVFEHMLRSHSEPPIASEAHPFHRQVLEAIRARDEAAAREAMRGHLAVARHRYGEDLDLGIEHLARRELERLRGPGEIETPFRVRLSDLLSEEPSRPSLGSTAEGERS